MRKENSAISPFRAPRSLHTGRDVAMACSQSAGRLSRAHGTQNRDEEPVVDGEVLRPHLVDCKDPVSYDMPDKDSPQKEDEEPLELGGSAVELGG